MLECHDKSDSFNTVIASTVSLGLVVSYIPQFTRIVLLKSSQGISPWFLLLGSFGCLSTLSNVFIFQYPCLKCCMTTWSYKVCYGNILSFFQVSIQTLCFFIIFILYFLYFPNALKTLSYTTLRDEGEVHPPSIEHEIQQDWVQQELQVQSKTSPLYKISLQILYIVLTYMAFVVVLCPLILGFAERRITDGFAYFFGILSTICGIVQYVPQIIHTIAEKSAGSLSIYMLLIQSPGSFVLAYSLAIAPDSSWSSWISYFVSGGLQAVLLVLLIRFQFLSSEALYKEEGEEEVDEPLIHQQDSIDDFQSASSQLLN